MAWILPKGIVVNSPEIQGSVERIDTEALDLADIARFWKVYTTTNRRLLDPTAERLENYWWRIWGSRRRELKGATVARLFAYISDGQSFVPLRGPPNRDEGTPPSKRKNLRPGPAVSSTTALHNVSQSRASTTSSSAASRGQTVMPPPILKKTRGPSATGPRPTARFISPPDSEGETGATSSASPNSHMIVEGPSPNSGSSKADKKPSPVTAGKKKGFVASTAANKKRPTVVRRPSSQTSQSSMDSTSKTFDVPQHVTPNRLSSEKPPLTSSAQTESCGTGNTPSKFQEASLSSSGHSRKRQSGKHGSSRRTSQRRPSAGVRNIPNGVGEESAREVAQLGEPDPSTKLLSVKNGQVSLENPGPEEELEQVEAQQMLLVGANSSIEKLPENRAQSIPSVSSTGEEGQMVHLPRPPRSRSDETQRPQDLSAMRLLPPEAKSTASLAPTLAGAAGQLEIGDIAGGRSSQTKSDVDIVKVGKGKGRDPDDLRRAEMFVKRSVQPASKAPVAKAASTTSPLSRSKSQLALLLEKDRASSGQYTAEGVKKTDRSNEDKKRDKKKT